MLRDSNIGNAVAAEMNRLLSDQEFQSKFAKPKLVKEYEEALNPDPSYKAFVRIAKKKEDKEEKKDEVCKKCKQKKCRCRKGDDKNEALAFRYIVDTLTKTSEALDNMGLPKSATVTLALINGLIKEAVQTKLGDSVSDIEKEMASRLEGATPDEILEFEEEPDLPNSMEEPETMEETIEVEEGKPGEIEEPEPLKSTVLDANDALDRSSEKVKRVMFALKQAYGLNVTDNQIVDAVGADFVKAHSVLEIAREYMAKAQPQTADANDAKWYDKYDTNDAIEENNAVIGQKVYAAVKMLQNSGHPEATAEKVWQCIGRDRLVDLAINYEDPSLIAKTYVNCKAQSANDTNDDRTPHTVDVKQNKMKTKPQESEEAETKRHEKEDIPTNMPIGKTKKDRPWSKDMPEVPGGGLFDANDIKDKEIIALYNKVNEWVKKS